MKFLVASWPFRALLSAAFAALTAVFAKVGVQKISPDCATFLRTPVVAAMLGGILTLTGQRGRLGDIPPRAGAFLVLSGVATGASWFCYFRALKLGDAARVAPVDKLTVVLVAIFGVIFLGETLGRWLGSVSS